MSSSEGAAGGARPRRPCARARTVPLGFARASVRSRGLLKALTRTLLPAAMVAFGGEVKGSDFEACQAGAPTFRLMPEEDAIFYPKPATFTPLYEPPDSASYTARFASVNAGAFELYVGGGAINMGFARVLDKAGQRVDDYQRMHRTLYEKAKAMAAEYKVGPEWTLVSWSAALPPTSPAASAPSDNASHVVDATGAKWSVTTARVNAVHAGGRLVAGVASTHVMLSTLPERFSAFDTLAGTVFIDIFDEDLRPESNPNNRAMVYVIGPEGSLAKDRDDFLAACQYTGGNMARALTEYNKGQESDTLEMVRMCLVSGGLFRHPETSKVDVAAAFVKGISAHYEPGRSPKIEFAYDEDVFQIAYKQLAAQADKPEA